MKRSQPKRRWDAAREKVEDEGVCRICSERWGLEAAHVIGRDRDSFVTLQEGASLYHEPTVERERATMAVHPSRIVPLCKRHHDALDGRSHETVDLLPHLTLLEQAQAVWDAGGIESARRRLAPSLYSRGSERRREAA